MPRPEPPRPEVAEQRWTTLGRRMLGFAAMLTIIAAVTLLPVVAWSIVEGGERRGATAGAGTLDDPPHTAGASGYRLFARNADGTPVRWDACSTISVVVNPSGGPPGWLDVLDDAVRLVGDASGLDLVIEGFVDERPDATRPAYDEQRNPGRWAPVLVAWARPGDDVPMRAHDHALAIPLAVGHDGARVFVSGQIVLNAQRVDDPDVPLDPERSDRQGSLLATLLHEFGHLLGLDHVDDPAQIMYPSPADGDAALGDGDRAGLAVVGTDTACASAPEPGPTPFDASWLTSN